MFSCQKETKEAKKDDTEPVSGNSTNGGGALTSCRDELEPGWYADSALTQTILGYQLNGNPYSVATMQQAAINLYGNNNGITANKKYVRFRPVNEDQVQLLQESDLELFDYPLDRDVVEEGDYYVQAGLTEADNPWLYTVVDLNYTAPAGITYEELQQLYVPDDDLLLEDEALRLTGNPLDESCGGISYRPPVPCEIDPCGPACPPLEDNPCGGGGGGGSDIPTNPRKPSGQIVVWDSNFDRNVPVRQTRVIARRWFKIETMYTNDQGRFQSRKRFRNKVNVFVKFLNNNIRVTRALGNPVTRTLFPMKRGIGIYSGNLNNINFTFERGNLTTSRTHRYWWAAQLMNAYLEYNEMATAEGTGQLSPLPLSNKLRVVLTRWSFLSGSGATPMNTHRLFPGQVSADYIRFFFVNPTNVALASLYNAFLNGALFKSVDMGLGFNTNFFWESNRVKGLMYHEMTHTAHFAKVGDSWWSDFVAAESFTLAANGFTSPTAPYGLGNDGAISDIISVGESYAEHLSQVFCQIRYGALNNFNTWVTKQGSTYSFDSPVLGLGAHFNALEDFNPNRTNDPFRWIPEGIYYDLFDNRNDDFFNPAFPFDNVVGYTDQQFFNALDNDVRSMPQYRNRLLQQNGNNQLNQVTTLFTDYGY